MLSPAHSRFACWPLLTPHQVAARATRRARAPALTWRRSAAAPRTTPARTRATAAAQAVTATVIATATRTAAARAVTATATRTVRRARDRRPSTGQWPRRRPATARAVMMPLRTVLPRRTGRRHMAVATEPRARTTPRATARRATARRQPARMVQAPARTATARPAQPRTATAKPVPRRTPVCASIFGDSRVTLPCSCTDQQLPASIVVVVVRHSSAELDSHTSPWFNPYLLCHPIRTARSGICERGSAASAAFVRVHVGHV